MLAQVCVAKMPEQRSPVRPLLLAPTAAPRRCAAAPARSYGGGAATCALLRMNAAARNGRSNNFRDWQWRRPSEIGSN
jgi:hypothetical protein